MKKWYLVYSENCVKRCSIMNHLNYLGIKPECIKVDNLAVYYYHDQQLKF